jgi:hypothetical protein
VFLRHKAHIENIDYQFNGRVDSVFYDMAGSPTIIVKGQSYYLPDYDWHFTRRFGKGDLVFKKSRLMMIKLTRPKTGEVIIIKELSSVF